MGVREIFLPLHVRLMDFENPLRNPITNFPGVFWDTMDKIEVELGLVSNGDSIPIIEEYIDRIEPIYNKLDKELDDESKGIPYLSDLQIEGELEYETYQGKALTDTHSLFKEIQYYRERLNEMFRKGYQFEHQTKRIYLPEGFTSDDIKPYVENPIKIKTLVYLFYVLKENKRISPLDKTELGRLLMPIFGNSPNTFRQQFSDAGYNISTIGHIELAPLKELLQELIQTVSDLMQSSEKKK